MECLLSGRLGGAFKGPLLAERAPSFHACQALLTRRNVVELVCSLSGRGIGTSADASQQSHSGR